MSGEVFGQLLDSLETAQDAEGVKRGLKSFASALGFNWFAYLSARGSDVQALSTYPRSWQRRYLDRNYAEIDPVVQRARKELLIFNWSNSGFGSDLSPTQGIFFGEALEHGIRSGTSVPVAAGFGRLAVLTFAASERHDDYLVRNPSLAASVAIQVDFHIRRWNLTESFSAKPDLTSRELTCLNWAAEGKRMAETGQIIGTAERTVEFHLEKARDKLGACNLTHAVALAIRLNLL